MKTTIKKKGDVVKLIADSGYTQPGRVLAKVTDSGNGFICKFPSWTSVRQDNYVCLGYDEAAYLLKALKHFDFLEQDDGNNT